ncbi:hypothetical protein BDV95DRAFT_597348 [Massariosphaeria phaeospora]|uniref:Transcription factor TFIIIB component B'' Myb domain-containing protein n=1 Tax=Massariosphaeria phaeospora TaxID=100035 RepID=A0A7C8M642_9PLEO|nr:hypothetical protein BDV95DRAFT_597348 [Massariosphaeria phaeospora]
MSADGGSAPPPPPPPTGASKTQASKFTTSFINKSGVGKKFAPKAVRRRPGAVAAAKATTEEVAASTPTAATSEVPASTEPHKSQAEPSPAPAIDSQTEQLPTPAATQEVSSQNTPAEQPVALPAAPVVHSAVASPTVNAANKSSPALAGIQHPVLEKEVRKGPSPVRETAQPLEDELESGRSPKRRRIEPVAQDKQVQSVPETATPAPILTTQDGTANPPDIRLENASNPTSTSEPSQEPATQPEHSQATEIPSSPQNATAVEPPVSEGQSSTQPSRPTTRGARPWTAVNQNSIEQAQGEGSGSKKKAPPRTRRRKGNTLRDFEDEEAEEARGGTGTVPKPSKKSKKTPARTRKPKANTLRELREEEEEGEETGPGDESRVAPPPLSEKAKGKRKVVDTTETEANVDASQAPAKRVRKARKDKGKKRNQPNEQEEGDGENVVEEERPKRKRKKKATTQVEGQEDQEGQDSQVPRRRRRPPREDTPSDAEDHVIEPEATFMADLASRNIRVGRLSALEKKMREVDWAEVKQRRKEEEAVAVAQNKRDARNREKERATEEATQQEGAPQYETVDGQIVLVQNSGNIDREGDALRAIDLMEHVEDHDVTKRTTTSSYLRLGKKHPTEFMLPGQGIRWTSEATAAFYTALENWGTDFEHIAPLFPGLSRRSIKLKFTREERADPARVRRALHAQKAVDYADYVRQTDGDLQALEALDDPDEIEARLNAELKVWEDKVKVEKAKRKEELEEIKARRRAQGLPSEDENERMDGNGSVKMGARKKKGVRKQVGFAVEEGVEMLGALDE